MIELTSDEEDVTKKNKIIIRSDVWRFYKWGGGGGSRGGIHFKSDFERYMEGDPSDYMPSTDDGSDYKVPRGNDRYENMPSTDYETDNGYESDIISSSSEIQELQQVSISSDSSEDCTKFYAEPGWRQRI